MHQIYSLTPFWLCVPQKAFYGLIPRGPWVRFFRGRILYNCKNLHRTKLWRRICGVLSQPGWGQKGQKGHSFLANQTHIYIKIPHQFIFSYTIFRHSFPLLKPPAIFTFLAERTQTSTSEAHRAHSIYTNESPFFVMSLLSKLRTWNTQTHTVKLLPSLCLLRLRLSPFLPKPWEDFSQTFPRPPSNMPLKKEKHP